MTKVREVEYNIVKIIIKKTTNNALMTMLLNFQCKPVCVKSG